MISKDFKSSIADKIVSYISYKKSLGRKFDTASWVLFKLDQFLYSLKPSAGLSSETFKLWCQSFYGVSANTRLSRMRIVYHFCLYCSRRSPNCYVPDPNQFPKASPTASPYIVSEQDVSKMLGEIESIQATNRSPLRMAATRIAIILLYTTGIRVGELLRLRINDYNRSDKTLMIRNSKFFKSRLLPLPNDVAIELENYLKKHEAATPLYSTDTPLIYSPYCGGRPYSITQLRKNFYILFDAAGVKKPNGRYPRIHDFRFSFAVNALIRWYVEEEDVQAKLPFLSAYMGHISILSTYYYLKFIEPLAAQASMAFAENYESLIQESMEGTI